MVSRVLEAFIIIACFSSLLALMSQATIMNLLDATHQGEVFVTLGMFCHNLLRVENPSHKADGSY